MQNVTATRLSFNTQPPEGGWPPRYWFAPVARVSTHSRPKAAGSTVSDVNLTRKCFNTQPPEGGWAVFSSTSISRLKFQHTAARRRLGHRSVFGYIGDKFQHTAARRRLASSTYCKRRYYQFQHTAARRRLGSHPVWRLSADGFNTQPPEGGWLSRRRPQW